MGSKLGVAAILQVLLLVLLCISGIVHARNNNRGSNRVTILCPSQCSCSNPRHMEGIITDCSRAGIVTIPVAQMDPNTVRLDLTHNGIQQIRKETFLKLDKLEVLLLSDNQIHNLEANAFYGLHNLHVLDLKRNRLQILKGNSLAHISGHPVDCVSDISCVLDLSENDLELIESNALAWIEKLNIIIGHGSMPLTLKSYAFYGLEDIPSISIRDVPSLTLERHAITNAERVGSVLIMNTRLADIQNFTFQGLEDVGSIVFHNTELSEIKTLGFGAVTYNEKATTVGMSPLTGNITLTGGVFNMSYCQIAKLDSDIFRDTNLAHITLTGNRIYEIGENAFRGLSKLQTFHMVSNTISSLGSSSLGALSGLRELILDRNEIDVIEGGAFRGNQYIDHFRLSLKLGSNLTLGSYAFTDVIGISKFEIVGSAPLIPSASFTKTTLSISQDAFHDLVADSITVENVSLPTLKLNSFRGFSKVKNLAFISCDVQEVETGAFGESYGAVHTMEMKVDTRLTCDCDTHRLHLEFQRTFAKFDVHCLTEAQPATVDRPAMPPRPIPLENVDWASCVKGLGTSLHMYSGISGLLSTIVVFTLTCFLL